METKFITTFIANLTREDIIGTFTDNLATFQKYAKNIAGEDADDLFQECALMLLEFNEDRLKSYWNEKEGLKPFFIRLLLNQYKSTTSKYHKEYRKQNQFIQAKGKDIIYNSPNAVSLVWAGPTDEEVDFKEVEAARNGVHKLNGEMFPNEAEEMVFGLYVETGSLRKALAAIPEEDRDKYDLKKVHEIVKKFRRTIKNHLNKQA